jgi:hypothetical protein
MHLTNRPSGENLPNRYYPTQWRAFPVSVLIRLLSLVAAASTLAACASIVPVGELPPHAAVTQNGRLLVPAVESYGVYTYSLKNAPFSIVVPNTDMRGRQQDAGHVPILVCASTSPSIFQGIAVGRSIGAMPCLNGATSMARSTDETPEGVELMLSTGNGHNNFDDLHTVLGPGYTTVNVRKIIDFKVVGRVCFGKNGTNCRDKREEIAFGGGNLYLIVFTDMNRNHAADAGEYTLLTLRIAP